MAEHEEKKPDTVHVTEQDVLGAVLDAYVDALASGEGDDGMPSAEAKEKAAGVLALADRAGEIARGDEAEKPG